MDESQPDGPLGTAGAATDRDHLGRFAVGNRLAVTVGHRTAAFWQAHADALREIRDEVIADAGFTDDDAPRALKVAATGLAQAALVRDSAFERMVETGGPLTNADRQRRPFTTWKTAAATVERHLKLVGLHRAAKPALSFVEQMRAATAENERARQRDADDE